MNVTLNDLYDTIRRVRAYDYQPVKKIKVTSKFYHYLMTQCDYQVVNTPFGMTGAFVGIPIITDDTIENEYYELVF